MSLLLAGAQSSIGRALEGQTLKCRQIFTEQDAGLELRVQPCSGAVRVEPFAEL